jgi:hypothetical protein
MAGKSGSQGKGKAPGKGGAGTGAAAKSAAATPAPTAKPAAIAGPTVPRLTAGSLGWIGLVCAAVLGLGLLCSGLYALAIGADAPKPLIVSLLLVGSLQIGLSWLVLGRNRAAWAFLLSSVGTAALIFLFASPRLRDAFDVALPLALLPSTAFALTTIFLALASDEIEKRR